MAKTELKLHVANDGIWINFESSNGGSAMITVQSIADKSGAMIHDCLVAWINDILKEIPMRTWVSLYPTNEDLFPRKE